MLSIETFIEQSNRATSVEELFEYYKKAMMSLGFDQIIFSLMTNHTSIERPAGHGIIANYSESWMKYYQEKKYEDFVSGFLSMGRAGRWRASVRQAVPAASSLPIKHCCPNPICCRSSFTRFFWRSKRSG